MPSSTTTFGATIVPTSNSTNNQLLPQPVTESPALTPAASREDLHVPIQSPFYEHPPASREVSHSRQASAEKIPVTAVFEKDIESGNHTPLSDEDDNPFTRDHGVEHNKECSMWPSRQTLQQKRKAERNLKRKEGGWATCAPARNVWSKLSKKQRLLSKIALALFLVGVAVAVGVGISVAVKGTYYSGEGNSKNVGK